VKPRVLAWALSAISTACLERLVILSEIVGKAPIAEYAQFVDEPAVVVDRGRQCTAEIGIVRHVTPAEIEMSDMLIPIGLHVLPVGEPRLLTS
jgi:hypothetical protein